MKPRFMRRLVDQKKEVFKRRSGGAIEPRVVPYERVLNLGVRGATGRFHIAASRGAFSKQLRKAYNIAFESRESEGDLPQIARQGHGLEVVSARHEIKCDRKTFERNDMPVGHHHVCLA